MPPYDRHAIAARLRKLLRPGFIELPAIAARLGVDEGALRVSMRERSPRPSVDVLAAVVRQLGVKRQPRRELGGAVPRPRQCRRRATQILLYS